jgi:Na+/proline symporter
MIIMLFMAITSTGSAECIAVSSLVAYDIYREYINPKATGADILRVSRITIIVYGVIQGCLAALLQNLGIGIGWMYNFMGIMIGSAVWPVAMLVLDSRVSAAGAMSGAIVGNIGSVIAWIVVAATENDGTVCGGDNCDVDTLGTLKPQLAGNVTALLLSALVCSIVSACKPQNFDWKVFVEKISLIDDDGGAVSLPRGLKTQGLTPPRRNTPKAQHPKA